MTSLFGDRAGRLADMRLTAEATRQNADIVYDLRSQAPLDLAKVVMPQGVAVEFDEIGLPKDVPNTHQ